MSKRLKRSEVRREQHAEHLGALLNDWRAYGFAVARKRKFGTSWEERLAHHVLESSELTEALRGKGKRDIIEEAGDMLVTALTMIPEEWDLMDVVKRNLKKLDKFMEKG